MKNRLLIVGGIIVLPLLLFTFICENKSAFASDQNLTHGAGTLPHLTGAGTVSVGIEYPTPILYAFRYDIGLGNRVQLGIAASSFFGGRTIGRGLYELYKISNSGDTLEYSSGFHDFPPDVVQNKIGQTYRVYYRQ